jgi:hypothetical protein
VNAGTAAGLFAVTSVDDSLAAIGLCRRPSNF